MNVSVIIPTRDRSLFLEDAVRSVLMQTRTVHEILVIDDGSRAEDRSGVERVVSLSPLIRLLRLPVAGGVSAARNVGLDNATGDGILFLDDDDLLHPRMIEECARLLEQEPPADVASCLYEMFFTPDGQGPWIPAALLFNHRLLDSHPLRLVDATNVANRKIFEEDPFSAFLRFLIVGRLPPGVGVPELRDAPEVSYLGGREDLAACYGEANAVVAPLRAGGGTRIKVLEAFSMARPVVTTPVGAEGIDAADGVHVLMGADAESLARQCVRLMEEPGLARSLVQSAEELYLRAYRPEVAAAAALENTSICLSRAGADAR